MSTHFTIFRHCKILRTVGVVQVPFSPTVRSKQLLHLAGHEHNKHPKQPMFDQCNPRGGVLILLATCNQCKLYQQTFLFETWEMHLPLDLSLTYVVHIFVTL